VALVALGIIISSLAVLWVISYKRPARLSIESIVSTLSEEECTFYEFEYMDGELTFINTFIVEKPNVVPKDAPKQLMKYVPLSRAWSWPKTIKEDGLMQVLGFSIETSHPIVGSRTRHRSISMPLWMLELFVVTIQFVLFKRWRKQAKISDKHGFIINALANTSKGAQERKETAS